MSEEQKLITDLTAGVDSRAAAADILREWSETGSFPNRQLDALTKDRPFVQEVVYGVLKHLRILEWIVRRYAVQQPTPDLEAVIWVGFYQLLYMDHVPDYAAVQATVGILSRDPRLRPQADFVNALLRRLQKEREGLRLQFPALPLDVRESHPRELVARWYRQWPQADVEALCHWNNSRAEVIVRPRAHRGPVADWRAQMAVAGIELTPHPFAPEEFFIVPHGWTVPDLPGFKEGLFTIQDPATLAAVRLLDPQPGEAVWDACAAPGGKTVLISERMQGKGCLTASDRYSDRMDRLMENLRRLKVSWVDIRTVDLRSPNLAKLLPVPVYDRILLDVPCSNTGVLRRKPDARWRYSDDRLRELVQLQAELLTICSAYLKPGGTLVYSSCSLENDENQGQVQRWLARRPDFQLTGETFLFPSKSQTDGAYAARLVRGAAAKSRNLLEAGGG
jgi:16S rRNA (cytosine967-C5)-methyltransferase